jgi:hypothetical protein
VIPFSARAAAINAATLAVLDNGSVGMKGTVFAVAIAVLRPRANHYQYSDIPVEENGTGETLFVLDPTPEEELQAKSRYIVGWVFGAGIPAVSSRAVPDDEDEEMDQQERPAEIKSECVHLESEGDSDAVTFQKAYTASREACKIISDTVRREFATRAEKLKIT